MDIRQLSYVVAVADHGGFTRAAEHLGISQPSLSQAVRALEHELGTELFLRSGRTVRLTPAGEALLDPARQAQRDLETARAAVDAVRGVSAGHLDLVSLPTLAAQPLAGLVGRFRRAHDGVTVRVLEPEEAASIPDLVRAGVGELAVCELPLERSGGLVTHDLGEQRYHVVLPPAASVDPTPGRPTAGRPTGRGPRNDGSVPPARPRTVTIEELAAVPLVTTPPGTSTRRLLEAAFRDAGIAPAIAVETDHREALIPLALAGAGAALVPETLAAEARLRGAETAVLEPAVTRRIGLVHRDGPLSPAAAAFLALALPDEHHHAERPRARRR